MDYESAFKESKKCILLCANCHRKVTNNSIIINENDITHFLKSEKDIKRSIYKCKCSSRTTTYIDFCFNCKIYLEPFSMPLPETIIENLCYKSYKELSKELKLSISFIKKYLRENGLEPSLKGTTKLSQNGLCGCGRSKDYKAQTCKDCYKQPTKINWPPVLDILAELETKSYVALATALSENGVKISDNAIRKHLKRQGVNPPKKQSNKTKE